MGAELTIVVNNKLGLHARPADLFVRCANNFKSTIKFSNETRKPDKKANAKSILGVLSSGVHCGDTIHIYADGEDEEAAVAAFRELIESNFGE